MGKLSNTITMLELLNSGKKYSVNELASILEVTPRMVRLYKEELESAGIYIDTIYGPFGGYILNKKVKLPKTTFKKDDYEFLINLEVTDDKKKKLTEIADKVRGLTPLSPKNVLTDEIKICYNTLAKAIKQGKKVSISYYSLNKGLTKRIIHPQDLFYTPKGWELSAFCELRGDLRLFELERIDELTILNDSFE